MAAVNPSWGVPPAVVVALGGVFGAWTRYAVMRHRGSKLRERHWATWGINMTACFLMGLLVGLEPRWARAMQGTLQLALAVGFLGSLSTYSSLMAELVRTWRKPDRRQALALAGASIVGGLMACQLGLSLATAQL